ncbi:MAG: GGDEF domain-containing protein, partial [Planctomycetota bacterium]
APARVEVERGASRLQSLSDRVSYDLVSHQEMVAAVNAELLGQENDGSEAVFSAVDRLIAANASMQQQLQQAKNRIEKQSHLIETTQKAAETDALTKMKNRRAFDVHIEQRHELNAPAAGTLMLLDVDHFKKFNDVHGHQAGDEVLRVVAEILQNNLHRFGIAARFGGEEFAVVLDGMPVVDCLQVLEETRREIGEREIVFDAKALRVRASVGVAEMLPGETIEQWIQRADEALYDAKDAGRNRLHWMDGSTTRPLIECDDSMEEPVDDSAVTSQGQLASMGMAANDATGSISPPTLAEQLALPDREQLAAVFAPLMRNMPRLNVSLYVMMVRIDSQSHHDAAMRIAAKLAGTTARAIDRLGYESIDQSLLVCLPGMTPTQCEQRASDFRNAFRGLIQSDDAIQTSDVRLMIAVARGDGNQSFQALVHEQI